MAGSSLVIQQGDFVGGGRGIKCGSMEAVQLTCRMGGVPRSPPQPRVTFLIYMLSRGVITSSVPICSLPVLQRPVGERGEHSTASVELCIPGSYLFNVVAAGCSLPFDVVQRNFRIILQGKQVSPDSFVPIEEIVGFFAASAPQLKRFESQDGRTRLHCRADTQHTLCSLWVILRLLGGKGGFGALLKKQRRKRRANFSVDACR